jgi:hypothetical protein
MAQQDQQQDTRVPVPGDADYKPMPHDDDAELTAARKDAEAEAAAASAEAEDGQAGEATQDGAQGGEQPQGEPAETAPPARQQTPMIPKPRFDEAVQAAYWRGRAEAAENLAKGTPNAPAADDKPAKSPEEEIAELDAAIDQAAAQYDAGELSFAQFNKLQRTNEAKIAELRQARTAPAQGDDQTARQEDLYLAERTDDLAVEFPILTKLSAADVEPLVPLAYREAARDRVQITPDSRGDYLLRRYVAHVATKLYGTGAPAQQPSQKPPAANADAGRRKLALAARMPPDLTTAAGGRQQVPDPASPERLATMDVDDIAALPAATRQRIAGY